MKNKVFRKKVIIMFGFQHLPRYNQYARRLKVSRDNNNQIKI